MTSTSFRLKRSPASTVRIWRSAARWPGSRGGYEMTDATMAYADGDLHHLQGTVAHSGPASKRIVTGYGFWIFILSDMVMFSAFFATYAVLLGQTAGGPSGHDLFDLRNVAIETLLLLASSFTCGLASIAADSRSAIWFQLAMAVTCAF